MISSGCNIGFGVYCLGLIRGEKVIKQADEFGAVIIITEGAFDILMALLIIATKGGEGFDIVQKSAFFLLRSAENIGGLGIISIARYNNRPFEEIALAWLIWVASSDAIADLIYESSRKNGIPVKYQYIVGQLVFICLIIIAVITMYDDFVTLDDKYEWKHVTLTPPLVICVTNLVQIIVACFDK